MTTPTIRIEVPADAAGQLHVIIDNPSARNALTHATAAELGKAVRQGADDPDVRAMLQIAGARDPWEVLTRYAFGPADVGELSEGGRIITDDGAWLDHVAWRDLLTAVHDPTASAWQQEIGLAIGDRGQLSALLRPQGPGPARGRTALGLATALVHARRWDQAARWTGVAKAEGMPTDALDAAFRARGKVLIQPAPRL